MAQAAGGGIAEYLPIRFRCSGGPLRLRKPSSGLIPKVISQRRGSLRKPSGRS